MICVTFLSFPSADYVTPQEATPVARWLPARVLALGLLHVAASGACSRPTPVAKLAAIGAHEGAFSYDQSMPRRQGLGRRQKGGSRQLELAAACQARQAVGMGKYASRVLDEEVVDDDAVDNVVVNLDKVHNEVEANIVTVRNQETSK